MVSFTLSGFGFGSLATAINGGSGGGGGTANPVQALVLAGTGTETSFTKPALIGATIVAVISGRALPMKVKTAAPIQDNQVLFTAGTGTVSVNAGVPFGDGEEMLIIYNPA